MWLLSRGKLGIALAGSALLFLFPSSSNFLLALAVCIKLVNVLSVFSRFPLPHGVRHFGNVDIGWCLMASASPLLALHIILKLIEHAARTVSQYLQRWNSEGRIDPYAMIVTEIVGAVLLADSELGYLRKVCNTFPNQSHFRF